MNEPYYSDDTVTVYEGDCVPTLAALPDASVDAVVTDPPYSLGFMNRAWDRHDTLKGFQTWCLAWSLECLRVLKPGGHLLAFGGTRTYHRMVCAIEDAGFEIRDSIHWIYGSGFPKSLDVSKAIDKTRDDKAAVLAVTSRLADLAEAAGVSRGDVDAHMGTSDMGGWWLSRLAHRCACPSVENWTRLRDLIPGAPELDAEVWRLNGRKGTPDEAWERREVIGESPHSADRTSNIGYGADLESEGRRFVTASATDEGKQWDGWQTALKPAHEPVVVARKPLSGTVAQTVLEYGTGALNVKTTQTSAGRWPTNLVLGEPAAEEMDRQSGTIVDRNGGRGGWRHDGYVGGSTESDTVTSRYRGEGGASRFFPVFRHDDCPACGEDMSSWHRDARDEHLLAHDGRYPPDLPLPVFRYEAKADTAERPLVVNGVRHPTVKPIALMRWLVRLVTPPGGTVLDPFAGSGTTVEACIHERFHCIAVERDEEYLPLIQQRIDRHRNPAAYLESRGEVEGTIFDVLDDEEAAS